jgi:hypothetical protein
MKIRRVFDIPFDLLKEKMFSYHSRVNVHFLLTKYSKIEATTQYFKKCFYKKVLDFHRPSNMLKHFDNYQRSYKITAYIF